MQFVYQNDHLLSENKQILNSVLFAQENYETQNLMDSINITNCRAGFSLIDIKTTSFEFRKINF